MDPTAPVNRRWLLHERPTGPLTRAAFRWVEEPVPTPGDGELLVRVLMLSCDPTQRGWLTRDTYMPAVPLGDVVRSLGVGRVVATRGTRFAVGDLVSGLVGWQDYAVLPEHGPLAPSPLPPGVPLPRAMSALGLTGLTAYFGLLAVGRPAPGETVVVSGAAGATGSVAVQLARLQGCRVIGIAGGAEKCRWLVDVARADAAIDYKAEPVGRRLRELCPRGIDVFFDNVGGDVLDAALAQLALRGRIVLCGGISQYAASVPAGPRNYLNLVVKRGRMEGFLVSDHAARFPEALAALGAWIDAGELVDRVDIQDGLEHAPEVLARLFTGENLGKQLLRVAP